MSDRFRPLSMEQLTAWVFTELAERDALFNVPRRAFFVPRMEHRFRTEVCGTSIDTPFGVAAGPHTQLAQNVVAAWLVGARVIELKTVQTLDELDVHKPCIDMADEGYNVEWSQELRVHQSFDEYLRAWVLIHALHRHFGWPGERPGVVFNMSVGYNLEGIRKPNVQWYLDAMADASAFLPAYVEIVARHDPTVRGLEIPTRLSDTVTLSTMHGCPPDEIEQISRYLLEERGLHTQVKCNPTLLGAERVRGIVNEALGFVDVPIPEAAFGHDLAWGDAVPMFRRLRGVAAARGLSFGLKLSNTLEVDNWRRVFDRDPTMYLSGRPLHAVTTNLAAALVEEFGADLPISFAGGADCFNVADLLASGMRTVTVCSDLLKSGGYLRLLQYAANVDAAIDAVGARDTADFICRRALASGYDGEAGNVADCARHNLRSYAASTVSDWRYRKESFRTDRSKTQRRLGAFDCIAAPCIDTCPVDQAVPQYMDALRRADLAEAVRFTRRDNPLPSVLGRVCDHLCENTCVRTHLDEPLAIRHIKRFIMEQEDVAGAGAVSPAADARPIRAADRITAASSASATASANRIAVIGAGPAGLSAARDLAAAGLGVTIFEARPYPGGMVGGAIPAYRLPGAQIERDLAMLERLGVAVRYGMTAGADLTVEGLRDCGFAAIFIAVGAQRAKRLGLPGDDAPGVVDGITFLRGVREGHPVPVGPRVGVVGAGDTAMDCARSARRVGADEVSLVYRRTIDQMPADPEEIHAIQEEGIRVIELARPAALRLEEDRLAGLICTRTEYRGERDAAGRKVPFDVPDSAFEVGLDTLIVAISQDVVLDFFGVTRPALTPSGYIAVDPETLQTSLPGVYAGGDVSAHGPASIVRAAADGKRVAAAITASFGRVPTEPAEAPPGAGGDRRPLDVHALALRRARRAYRVPVRVSPPGERGGFEETVLGYSAEEAMREASRCLDCHVMCSLCVGVCPNIALLTYEAKPVRADVPSLVVAVGAVVANGSVQFTIDQRFQVAVLTDLCNECGNCVTACPTSGAPYRDKPRLYLDPAEFAAQKSNAFLLLGGGAMEGRFDGRTHRIEIADERIEYLAPTFRAVLDPGAFGLLAATPMGAADGEVLSLAPGVIMATLLSGLATSAPHLPAAENGGTFIARPAYEG